MIRLWSALGTKPRGERLARIRRSPQYRNGRFRNTLPTIHSGMSLSVVRDFFLGGSDHRQPEAPVSVVQRTAADFSERVEDLRVTWFGHSTTLIEMEGVRLLVDPVWGEHASPGAPFGVRRFFDPPLALADLPPVDAVLISHDHYDHLNEPTIRSLAERVPRFIVPLGVGAHLEYWGVAADRVTELDWWERTDVGGLDVVSTPARHFSGRHITDRDATLWCGWAVFGENRRVYNSGDTAMTPQLAEIGERLGPFDIALIECGAYNAAWSDVHLGPEQAVEAFRMVRGGLVVPVHWGTFDLALHGWTEPVERVRAAAEAAQIPIALPRPGESLTPDSYPSAPWWPDTPWEAGADAPVVSSGNGVGAAGA